MVLSNSQRIVLNAIKQRVIGHSVWGLHYQTNLPEASIRRVIGELRHMGWKIELRKTNGYFYRRYILVK
jgi:hypothetical protein